MRCHRACDTMVSYLLPILLVVKKQAWSRRRWINERYMKCYADCGKIITDNIVKTLEYDRG